MHNALMQPAKVPLHGKFGTGKYMLVDTEELPKLASVRWHVSDNGYAVNRTKRTTIRAHRVIMGTPSGMDTDHINGDKLDNRKINLRICSRSDNLHNKVSVGTWLDKRRGTWQVEISLNGKKRYLGAYKTKQQAMKMYEQEKIKLIGGRISRRTKRA